MIQDAPVTLMFFCCVSLHLQVKEEMLFEALTTRKTVTVGEKLIVPYKLSEVSLHASNNMYQCRKPSAVYCHQPLLYGRRKNRFAFVILSRGNFNVFCEVHSRDGGYKWAA